MSSHKLFLMLLHVIFIMATSMCASEATFFTPHCPPPPPPPQNNTATYYFQFTIGNGTNNAIANAIPVAGIQGAAWTLQQFGTIFVFDVNLTTTPTPSSTPIGQAYGTLTVTGRDGLHYLVSTTFVFTSGILAGCTLDILGIFNISQQVTTLAIVGGTNKLTYATGFAAYHILSIEQQTLDVQVTVNYKFAA